MSTEIKVGRIYNIPHSTNLYMVLAARVRPGGKNDKYDWLLVRGGTSVGRVYDGETAPQSIAPFTGELTDDEHKLCMSVLLDVDAYIEEHTA